MKSRHYSDAVLLRQCNVACAEARKSQFGMDLIAALIEGNILSALDPKAEFAKSVVSNKLIDVTEANCSSVDCTLEISQCNNSSRVQQQQIEELKSNILSQEEKIHQVEAGLSNSEQKRFNLEEEIKKHRDELKRLELSYENKIKDLLSTQKTSDPKIIREVPEIIQIECSNSSVVEKLVINQHNSELYQAIFAYYLVAVIKILDSDFIFEKNQDLTLSFEKRLDLTSILEKLSQLIAKQNLFFQDESGNLASFLALMKEQTKKISGLEALLDGIITQLKEFGLTVERLPNTKDQPHALRKALSAVDINIFRKVMATIESLVRKSHASISKDITLPDIQVFNQKSDSLKTQFLEFQAELSGVEATHSLQGASLPDASISDKSHLKDIAQFSYKASLCAKGIDTVVDTLRLAYKPTVENAMELSVSSALFYALAKGNVHLITAVTVYNICAKDLSSIFVAGVSMLVPYAMVYTGVPYATLAFTVGVTVYTICGSFNNAYNFIQEITSTTIEEDSKAAYKSLYDTIYRYTGLEWFNDNLELSGVSLNSENVQ